MIIFSIFQSSGRLTVTSLEKDAANVLRYFDFIQHQFSLREPPVQFPVIDCGINVEGPEEVKV